VCAVIPKCVGVDYERNIQENIEIKKIGIYFARYDYLHLIEVKDLIKNFQNIYLM
jgi:hypothetical protein